MRQETLIFIGCILIAGLIIFLVVVPAWDSLGMTLLKTEQQESRLAEIEGVADKITELEEQYQRNFDDFEKLGATLPQSQEVPSLLVQFESLAAANGIVMESISIVDAPEPVSDVNAPASVEEEALSTQGEADELAQPSYGELDQESQPAPSYKTSLVNLKLSGTYSAFKNYLQALEKNIRLMDVASFSLSPPSSQFGQSPGAPSTYTFSVVLNVYYQP